MKAKFTSKSIFNKLVNNKIVLYIVALICLFDILGYIIRYEFSAVLFFYLIGMITFNYTKNMTVVLGTALLATTLMHLIRNMMGFKEGMKGKKETDLDEMVKNIEEEEGEETEEQEPKEQEPEEHEDYQGIMKNKKKSGYQNQMKLNPGMYNTPNKEQISKQLGKAGQMEKAYDNLDKIIGQEGIKSISSHTKNLVKQQNELMKDLKDITPTLNEAVGAISKLDLSKLGNMFDSVSKNME
tara:strand:- start:6605 stop:7324 length:720 start_codon:yes stop_codon:yes gene_type:complete